MRRTGTIILILLSATIILSCAIASADQITITLDPPAEETKKDIRLNHETTGATRQGASSSSSQQYVAKTLGTKQSSGKETPIGRVGVVSASKADIKRGPSSKGHALFTCPKDTYLAIVGESGNWYGVLMVDGSTGWVDKSKVNLLDYQVVGSKTPVNGNGSQIVNTALKYLGIPYVWGGYSFSGLDCSGFVKAVFASHGISLPRVARDQASVGMPVGWNDLQPGDRLYFACKGGPIDHAGIYMGNGLFIHSSVSNRGVAVDNLTKPFYANSLITARR